MDDNKEFKPSRITKGRALFYLNILIFFIVNMFSLAFLLNYREKYNFSIIWLIIAFSLWGIGIIVQGLRVFRSGRISARTDNYDVKLDDDLTHQEQIVKKFSEYREKGKNLYYGEVAENEKLDLSSKGLDQLPDYIADLVDLKILYLYGNKIKTLPDFIGNLKNLEVLDLTGNELAGLPDSIGDLVKLRKLDLSFNKLTGLPQSIGKLINLEILILIKNELSSLPESIGNLTSLKELYLLGNKIDYMPESIKSLKQLERIN